MTVPASRDLRAPLIAARVIAVAGLGLLAILSATHLFDKDEIEHLHSAWLIASGLRPYSDFFQHHHRLMWDILAVLLPWTSQTASTVLTFRVLMFLQLIAVVILTYRLAAKASDGPLIPWIAVALLVSMSAFGRHAYLIRPDLPEVLCVTAGVLLLEPSRASGAWRQAVASGLLWGFAFLFSLKAVVVLAVLGPLLLVWWRQRRASTSVVAGFALGGLAPIAAYFAYMAATGTLRDYYRANWILNIAITADVSGARFTPGNTLYFNAAFWALAIGSAAWRLLRPDGRQTLHMVTITGLGIVILLVVLGRTESRSALVALPFLAVTAAAGFERIIRALQLSGGASAALLAAICALSLADLGRAVPANSRQQRHMIDFVLEQTPRGEPVHDGNNTFNMFRSDLHYFWFHPTLGLGGPGSVGRAARIRAAAAAVLGRASYEPCDLVRAKLPRILSTTTVDLNACGVAKDYAVTPYEGIWRRRH